jgi:hypothetical protein
LELRHAVGVPHPEHEILSVILDWPHWN